MNVGKMATICMWLSALTAAALILAFWGNWLVVCIFVLAAYPFAMFLGLLFGFGAQAIGLEILPNEDEDLEVWTDDIVILEKSEKIIGVYKDSAIHEWIVLKRPDTGEPIRCTYSEIVDMENDTVVTPEKTWFCILAPGIMYVADES